MVLPTENHQRTHPVIPLRIFKQYPLVPVPQSKLRKLALIMYKNEGLSCNCRISLVFCSDYAIRKLNGLYRDIDRATDVLSFTIGDPDLLGEIYISLERVKIQARRYETTCNDEIRRLFIHGFFHLLGYDHTKPGERKKMEEKEALYQ
jgi:probable rRNA maturation factor